MEVFDGVCIFCTENNIVLPENLKQTYLDVVKKIFFVRKNVAFSKFNDKAERRSVCICCAYKLDCIAKIYQDYKIRIAKRKKAEQGCCSICFTTDKKQVLSTPSHLEKVAVECLSIVKKRENVRNVCIHCCFFLYSWDEIRHSIALEEKENVENTSSVNGQDSNETVSSSTRSSQKRKTSSDDSDEVREVPNKRLKRSQTVDSLRSDNSKKIKETKINETRAVRILRSHSEKVTSDVKLTKQLSHLKTIDRQTVRCNMHLSYDVLIDKKMMFSIPHVPIELMDLKPIRVDPHVIELSSEDSEIEKSPVKESIASGRTRRKIIVPLKVQEAKKLSKPLKKKKATKEVSTTTYTCSECEKEFSSNTIYKLHMLEHEASFSPNVRLKQCDFSAETEKDVKPESSDDADESTNDSDTFHTGSSDVNTDDECRRSNASKENTETNNIKTDNSTKPEGQEDDDNTENDNNEIKTTSESQDEANDSAKEQQNGNMNVKEKSYSNKQVAAVMNKYLKVDNSEKKEDSSESVEKELEGTKQSEKTGEENGKDFEKEEEISKDAEKDEEICKNESPKNNVKSSTRYKPGPKSRLIKRRARLEKLESKTKELLRDEKNLVSEPIMQKETSSDLDKIDEPIVDTDAKVDKDKPGPKSRLIKRRARIEIREAKTKEELRDEKNLVSEPIMQKETSSDLDKIDESIVDTDAKVNNDKPGPKSRLIKRRARIEIREAKTKEQHRNEKHLVSEPIMQMETLSDLGKIDESIVDTDAKVDNDIEIDKDDQSVSNTEEKRSDNEEVEKEDVPAEGNTDEKVTEEENDKIKSNNEENNKSTEEIEAESTEDIEAESTEDIEAESTEEIEAESIDKISGVSKESNDDEIRKENNEDETSKEDEKDLPESDTEETVILNGEHTEEENDDKILESEVQVNEMEEQVVEDKEESMEEVKVAEQSDSAITEEELNESNKNNETQADDSYTTSSDVQETCNEKLDSTEDVSDTKISLNDIESDEVLQDVSLDDLDRSGSKSVPSAAEEVEITTEDSSKGDSDIENLIICSQESDKSDKENSGKCTKTDAILENVVQEVFGNENSAEAVDNFKEVENLLENLGA